MSSLHERRSRKSRLLSRDVIIMGLRFFWTIVVIWCEFGVFFYSLSDCRWPDKALKLPGSKDKPMRVLLISDPQVRNPFSSSMNSWFGYSSTGTYLRKSWSVVTRLHPQAVIFLGDMLASGRYVTNKEEYDLYYDEFKATFPLDASVPTYFIPGNNDVGLGESPSFSKNARQFYSDHFGPLNQAVSLAGHRLVLLDAPKLVEEDYRRHGLGMPYDLWTPITGGPIEFLNSIHAAEDRKHEPVILFSHIPLSRPSSRSCGPLREKGSIRAGAGSGYQNMLGKETTEFLLNSVRPAAVFSGDNRDYCDCVHPVRYTEHDATTENTIREVTVKSFSPARHIRRPGFQLLSLIPPQSASASSPTFADAHCLLPDNFRIFSSIYLPCITLTFIILLYLNVSPSRHKRRFSSLSPILLSPNSSRPPSPSRGPESAIWSTWSPRKLRVPVSPTTPLPPSLRVPNTKAAPALRASSSPATPQDSPLLSPITLFTPEDDGDDHMNPAQYISSYESQSRPASRDGEFDKRRVTPNAPFFLPPPNSSTRRNFSRSWSFVFWGRRRRMTISIPSFLAPGSWGVIKRQLTSRDTNPRSSRRRHSLVWRLASDSVSIALPAVLAWSVVGWLFF
ncbi:Metallo-dependent phosphatase [Leucogyrophana mollusca]|uniref:Metallo-dependent phosphatase n=1 Tax=Leucogyrophana mollusca TaxID=85980 RepID=A0ACB8B7B4_9AGAM|nr:Metallo-dependent phosphatase [Leucogyrophana mollusca]